MSEPLLSGSEESAARSEKFLGCIDCAPLLIWRAEESDRKKWKMFCSLVLILELGTYCYVVRNMPWLLLFGIVTGGKMLTETWGQDTPNWVCPGGVGMFLLIYCLIIPGIIYTNGLCTSNQDIVFPGRDRVGALLFCGGSGYSLWYEVNRFKWKALPQNKGKLHTIGLAAYCIHPNYFADLFTYTGWCICAGTTCALAAPFGMIWSFVYLVIPNSDAYLASRYPTEFPEYSRRVATFIPGVHNEVVLHILAWLALACSIYVGGNCAGQCKAVS
eukprot:TRINITY_DN35693_c0_g1_i1.p1 TRINITY_DN35693_c0_g1~~TRINITY_DN35693_c0_g1_i1.p1  ORF type:complete len:273 (-),score=-11.06 TRINITY_DN35693_c0_g1_i1:207-1025(-)